VDRKDPTEYSVSIPALYAIFVAHRDDAGRVRFTHVLEEEPRPGVAPPHTVVPHATEPGEDVVQAQLPAAGPGAVPRPRVIPF